MSTHLFPDDCGGLSSNGMPIKKSALDRTVGDTIHSLFANTYEHVCSVPLCSLVDQVWSTSEQLEVDDPQYKIAATTDSIHEYINGVLSPNLEMSSEAATTVEYLVRNLVFMKLAFMREFVLRRYDTHPLPGAAENNEIDGSKGESSVKDTLYLNFESWFSRSGIDGAKRW